MEWLRNIRLKRENAFPIESLRQLPNAVILTGIECSGKTSFCKNQLSTAGFSRISFDDEFEKAVTEANSSSEKMMDALTVFREGNKLVIYQPRNKEEFELYFLNKTFKIGIHKMSSIVLKGNKASLDGTNFFSDTRTSLVKNLRDAGIQNIGCVWIDTPLDECLRRFNKR